MYLFVLRKSSWNVEMTIAVFVTLLQSPLGLEKRTKGSYILKYLERVLSMLLLPTMDKIVQKQKTKVYVKLRLYQM